MNKQRRQEIEAIIKHLDDIKDRIETVKDDERESFENMPEPLQQSERGEQIDEAANALEQAYDEMDGIIDYLNEAMGQ